MARWLVSIVCKKDFQAVGRRHESSACMHRVATNCSTETMTPESHLVINHRGSSSDLDKRPKTTPR